MKKIPLIPNAITAFGLTCGLFVIFKVNMVDPGEGTFQGLMATVGLLGLAAVADVLDGAIARAMGAVSEFGAIFDSLSDGIAFGVAPSVIVLKTLSMQPGTELSFMVTMCAMVFSLCGVLRLVRYSVTSPGDDSLELASKQNFTGLPIPAGAAAVVSANLFLLSPELHRFFEPSQTVSAIILSATMVVLGYFMISRWRFPSLKALHIRVASFQLVVLVGVTGVATFYGVLYHFPVVFIIAAWGYVLVGWMLSLARIIAGRRTHRLADFEPSSSED